MWRRSVVKALGVSVMSLAGCIGQNSPGDDPDETEPSPTTSPGTVDDRTATNSRTGNTMESGIPRTVTLEEQSTAGLRETFGIEAQVAVPESSVTTDNTAQIRITLENTTAQPRTLTYTRERCDLNLIPGQYQQDPGISLLLVSTEQSWERTETDCWVPDGRNLNCGIPAMDHEIAIDPDEPLRWTFRLWAEPKNYYSSDVCMPPGTYQFSRALRNENTEEPLSFALSVDSA